MRRQVRMVRGPALVKILGQCCVLGCVLSDREVTVRPAKMLPFELDRGSKLEVVLGENGDTWATNSLLAGTRMWLSVSGRLCRMAYNRDHLVVLIIGDSDAGKTTFSTFLANSCLRSGLIPHLIDADIGQGDLGPPGTIGSARIESEIIDLRDLEINKTSFGFVGGLSPPGFEGIVIDGIQTALRSAKSSSKLAKVFIVNTDGYIRGTGVPYKLHMAQSLNPDVIVCLGNSYPLNTILKRKTGALVLNVRSSLYALKSRTDRIERRTQQFARFIGQGRVSKRLIDIRLSYRGKQMPTIQSGERGVGTFVGLAAGEKIAGFGYISKAEQDVLEIATDVSAGDFNTVLQSDILVKDLNTELIERE